MNLSERVLNKIFKNYISNSIEYHAGGYFVRKQAAYLIFTSNNTAYYLERQEGLHPNDNRYEKLIDDLGDAQSFEILSVGVNVLSLLNSEINALVVPSVFIENVDYHCLTEILIDWGNSDTKIFNYVHG